MIMSGRDKQRGITLIGFMLVLVILLSIGYLAMKLVPIYNEYHSVVTAMQKVAGTPGVANMTPRQIKQLLHNNFYTSYVKSATDKDMSVTRKGGYKLRVKYSVQEPIVANIDIVAHFDHSELLAGR